MKKCLLIVLAIVWCLHSYVQGQSISYNLAMDGITPVSPQTFTIAHAAEFPASRYTGAASISIPFESIIAGGTSISLGLVYNANGVRVNQEASMVGLNWDLKCGGMILQSIMDGDDLDSLTKMRPDYYNVPLATEYPYRYDYPYVVNGPLWSPTGSTVPVELSYGGRVATDYYFQYNGSNSYRNTNYFDNHKALYDAEPDVFTADFNGHSLKFMLSWEDGSLVVMNNKGYAVSRQGDSLFIIATPDGEFYHFGVKTRVRSFSNGKGIFGVNQSVNQTTANSWRLTKIILRNKQEVAFSYSQSAEVENFPQYAYKWQQPDYQGEQLYINSIKYEKGFMGLNLNPVNGSYVNITKTVQSEKRVYPTRIVFPNGQVDFIYSNREDMNTAQKLDSVIMSSGETRKSYALHYSYYDTLSPSIDSSAYLVYGAKRLRLDNVVAPDSGVTWFRYDTLPFPRKNSCAQDLFGFYNGCLTNKSLVPNPPQHKFSLLPNNGENHATRPSYAIMGALRQVIYPTGGSATFEYEANQFNNYFVPDYDSNSNVISTGYGLRLKWVSYSTGDGLPAKKTAYTYYGGKAILPQQFFNGYTVSSMFPNGINGVSVKTWNVTETTTSDGFSSSPLSSINGVGYDSVAQVELDSNNVNLGRTVTSFVNNPDRTYRLVGYTQQTCLLPPVKADGVAENGSELSVNEYDSSGRLMRCTTSAYYKYTSPMTYGVRLGGQWVMLFYNSISYPSAPYWGQWLLGFYPIYDFHSRLQTKTIAEYATNGDSLKYAYTYWYSNNGVLTGQQKVQGGNKYVEQYTLPDGATGDAVATAMVAAHRLSDKLVVDKYHYDVHTGAQVQNFQSLGGGRFVPRRIADVQIDTSGTSGDSIITSYPLYDTLTGKPLQIVKNGVTTNLLYGYNREYLVGQEVYQYADPGKTMNKYADVAYTSFEYTGDSKWTFGANVQNSLPATTGTKYYYLQSNLSVNGLTAGNEYIVSYWSRSGAYVLGASSTVTGRTVNGWTFYEHRVTPSAATLSFSGTGYIDEVHVYPVGGQMETYTHKPLVGITSKADRNNNITWYQFDNFHRLQTVRDANYYVLLQYTYNYRGRYKNAQQSQTFIRNNCATNYIPDTITYVVPAGTYASNVSQAAADTKALAQITALGQYYTNTHGNCTPGPGTCKPEGEKWIDGACRVGVRENISSEYISGSGLYRCTYRYNYPYDGSTDGKTYTELNSAPCAL